MELEVEAATEPDSVAGLASFIVDNEPRIAVNGCFIVKRPLCLDRRLLMRRTRSACIRHGV